MEEQIKEHVNPITKDCSVFLRTRCHYTPETVPVTGCGGGAGSPGAVKGNIAFKLHNDS